MKKGNRKKIFISTLLVLLLLTTVGFAANNVYQKKLTGTLGRITFIYEGRDVTRDIESKYGSPAVVIHEFGERSYLPLRAMADLLDIEITYDDKNHIALINNKNVVKLEKDLKEKEERIRDLERDLEDIKENVITRDDVRSLEDELNNKYKKHEGVEFDIQLSKNRNTINVDIDIDTGSTEQQIRWDDLGRTGKDDFIRDIIDIILDEFRGVEIDGSIYDKETRKYYYTFTKKENENVYVSNKDFSNDDVLKDKYFDDLDDYIYDEFKYYDIKNAHLYDLSKKGKTIKLEIKFTSKYDYEWEDISSRKRKKLLENIADEAMYLYGDNDIDIRVFMGNEEVDDYFKRY